MSDLKALLARQKLEKANESSQPVATATDQPAADNSNSPAKPGLAFLKSQSQSQPVPSKDEPAQSATKAGGGTGLGFLAKQRLGATAGSSKVSDTDAGRGSKEESVSDDSDGAIGMASPAASAKAPDSLNDLADLDASEAGQGKQLTGGFVSRFADEIPATAPTRELPEDLDEQGRQFIASLDSIYGIMHEPDFLGNVVRSVMLELGSHPEYRKLIQPKDMHTMVKGMRESMGLARVKKEESKSKRAPSKGKSIKVDDIDVLAALDEFGVID